MTLDQALRGGRTRWRGRAAPLIGNDSDATENRSAAKAVYFRARAFEQLGDLPEALKGHEKEIALLKVVNRAEIAINVHLALIHTPTKN